MRRYTIDFDNCTLRIKTPNQDEILNVPELNKDDFKDFIPEKFIERSSFSWDFDAETFSVNEPLEKATGSKGKTRILPELSLPTPKMGKRYDEFLKLLDLKSIDFADLVRKESPVLAKKMGL